MLDRVTLGQDLIDSRGGILARAGAVLSARSIAEAAVAAPALPRVALGATRLAAEIGAPLEAPVYRHLFAGAGIRAAVERALLEVRLPEALFEELAAVARAAPALHVHALATAAVAVRMLLAAVGDARGVPDLAAAGLLHDLGMRHLPLRLARNRDRLSGAEVAEVASHPILGAFHLAARLGDHPAVAAAHGHHHRCGQGYPLLAAAPSRSVEVVAIASAFAALTAERPYRSDAYDARAAVDVLAAEARERTADLGTVRLLVHALRGGRGDPRTVQLAASRGGQVPEVNRHTPVASPRASP